MHRKTLLAPFSLCLALMLLTGCASAPLKSSAASLAAPDYPKGEADRFAAQPEEAFQTSLKEFSADSSCAVLSALECGTNGAYSPVSLYLALALSAAGAQGETQAELLGALRAEEMDPQALSANAQTLFTSLYTTGQFGHLKLASSLWLASGVPFESSFLTTAAQHFFAEVYELDFSADGAGEVIAQWLKKHCGGEKGVSVPPTVDPAQRMALYTCIDFQDEWTSCFSEGATAPGVFNREDGTKVTCDFLNKNDLTGFSTGTGYTACSLGCKDAGSMTFYLPDPGKTPADLLNDPAVVREMLDRDAPGKTQCYGEVTWSIPKFDFTSDLHLKETLRSLGIEKAFSQEDADFSGITAQKPFFLSSVRQAARVAVDEKGVTASAYTELAYAGAGMPSDRAEMILDRPFLFSITSRTGVTLFVGVVGDPTLS